MMLKPLLTIPLIVFLAGCATSDLYKVAFMASSNGQHVCSGLVSAPSAGANVANTASQRCAVFIPNTYTLEDLSVQPADPNASNMFAVVSEFKSKKDLYNKSTSKIEIFRHGTSRAKYTYTNEDIKRLISSDDIYQDCFMKVLDINWIASNELLIDIQPACLREHRPLNVEMVINTDNGRVLNGPVFVDLNTKHFNWANHASKREHELTIDRSASAVLINGVPVSGLKNGITKAEAAWVLN